MWSRPALSLSLSLSLFFFPPPPQKKKNQMQVLRDLHDHRRGPADPLERRVLPAGRRHDPGRLVLEAAPPAVAERAQPRHRARVRPVRGPAGADEPRAAQRGRVLLVAALHVLRPLHLGRPGGRVVPALLDRLRRHPRPAARRRAGRALAVAQLRQHPLRVPRVRTTRCGSRSGRRSPTPAVRACTVAATASTSPTSSRSRARSRSTTTAGSPTRGASTAGRPARAGASGSTAPTGRTRCCRASATTSRSSPATCCTS